MLLGWTTQSEQAKIAGLNAAINTTFGSIIQNEQPTTVGLNVTIHPGPVNASLGSSLQNTQAKIAGLDAAIHAGQTNQAVQPTCRAWRVNGQSWFADQGNYTLMFTLRMASSSSSGFSGYAQYYKGDPTYGAPIVGSQFIRGNVGSVGGVASIHMDVFWKNGSSGQYNGTSYGV